MCKHSAKRHAELQTDTQREHERELQRAGSIRRNTLNVNVYTMDCLEKDLRSCLRFEKMMLRYTRLSRVE